jgi:hypothetical protein
MLEVLPLEQNSLGLRVMLHHNAINTNVTEVTQHKKLQGNATTWPPGKYESHITSLPQKPVPALHIDPKRQTSILLTQMFFCELTENLSITTQWGKGCKLKGFMAVKYIFPEPTYRARQRTDRHCFAPAQHYESTQEIWWRQRNSWLIRHVILRSKSNLKTVDGVEIFKIRNELNGNFRITWSAETFLPSTP